MHLYIEITRRGTGFSRFPFSRQPNAIASIDAGRYFYRQGFRLLITTFTMALRTRVSNDLAAPTTSWARLLYGKETLAHLHLTVTMTSRASASLSTGFCPTAITGFTPYQRRYFDLFGHASYGFF